MKNLTFLFALICSSHAHANNIIDSAEFYFDKGIVEKNAKRFLVAATNFDKAITFNKNYTEAYIENAFANIEMRKTDAAKANFIKAHELQPTNQTAIVALTKLYFDYRQWDKAIEFAKKCSNCIENDKVIGVSNYEKENYIEAEKYLIRAIAQNPADAQANYTLGRNYMDMEAFIKAVPYYEKAVALAPEKNVWHFELGLLYYNNNNFASAAKAFENAEKNGYIVNNDFNENYGNALLYSGQYAKGEEKLFDLYKKKGNKEILREMAQTFYERRVYDRTLDYCQRLLELDPKDAKALYQAGLAYQKMGQKDKGQGMCDKAIEIDPSLASKRTKKGDMGMGL